MDGRADRRTDTQTDKTALDRGKKIRQFTQFTPTRDTHWFVLCVQVIQITVGTWINPYKASCSKLLLFEGFGTILV